MMMFRPRFRSSAFVVCVSLVAQAQCLAECLALPCEELGVVAHGDGEHSGSAPSASGCHGAPARTEDPSAEMFDLPVAHSHAAADTTANHVPESDESCGTHVTWSSGPGQVLLTMALVSLDGAVSELDVASVGSVSAVALASTESHTAWRDPWLAHKRAVVLRH